MTITIQGKDQHVFHNKVAGVLCLALFLFLLLISQAHASPITDWTDQFGSVSPGTDIAHTVDTDGNMYIGGYVTDTLEGQTHLGSDDAFVRKYARDGSVVWTVQFGTNSIDRVYGLTVTPDGLYASGYTEGLLGSAIKGGGDAFVAKFTTSGVLEWIHQFGTASFDLAKSVSVHDATVYVVGDTNGQFSGSTALGNGDGFVHAITATGTDLWTKHITTSGYDEVFSVSAAAHGVYVAGVVEGTLATSSQIGGSDAFVISYDHTGDINWTHQFGSIYFDQALSVRAVDNAVYVSGDTDGVLPGQIEIGNGDAFLKKIATSGTEVWTRQFGTSDYDQALSVAENPTGVYVGGFTEGSLGGESVIGNGDGYVRKYSSDGTYEWTSLIGTTGTDTITSISVFYHSIFAGGFTYGTFDGFVADGSVNAFATRIVQDSDSDMIYDDVDTVIETTSDTFTFNTSIGVIQSRGDQDLTVRISPTTTEDILIRSSATSGTTSAAEITLCGGYSTIYVDAGDAVLVTCGSVHLKTLEGSVDTQFLANDGTISTTTLPSGNSLVFEEYLNSFTAPVTNTEVITVYVAGTPLTVEPGTTETVITDDQSPTVLDVTINPNPALINTALVLSATISDVGTGSSSISSAYYAIDGTATSSLTASDGFYDEVTEQLEVALSGFSESGVHEICVYGSDQLNNVSESYCVLLAVYDPEAGHVTGGGWIDSPEGAYVTDPSATGRAHFGFVSRYENGASIPDGNTQFKFKAADLRFHSESYDWLVVAGSKAQFKGVGSVNGSGDHYGFMLTAIDDLPDTFRMKIWDKDTDEIVYDNKLDAPDTDDPSTVLGGGNIIIHN